MTGDSLAETILWRHPTAIVAVDGGKRVCYANRAARHLLAIGEDPVEGRNVVELFGGDESFAQMIDEAYDDGEQRRLRLACNRGESQIEVGLTVSPYLDEAPMLTMVLSFRSIEERQLLEDRSGQLERLASAERLVGGFAHQLRNPLAAISALVENLVAETPSSDPRIEYTSRLINQVTRMERLIRACLEFGLDASAVRQRSTAASIGRAAIDAFEARHGTVPRIAIEGGVIDVVVCEKQIVKCLLLLLEAALEGCEDVAKMELLVASEPSGGTGRFVRFVVRDEGPGIGKGDLARLFEPFYTIKARGEGMGLAPAQAMAVHNGGAIEVRSKPGDTQFILRLQAIENKDSVSWPAGSFLRTSVKIQ